MIAGPGWRGKPPAGVSGVIQCETDLACTLFRTQLFNPADLAAVQQIQARYQVQPLSTFLGQPAPAAAPPIDFPTPLTPAEQQTALAFFDLMHALLPFCPVHPSEQDLRARFARIGLGADERWDTALLSPELRQALQDGFTDAWAGFAALKAHADRGEVISGDLFGTRRPSTRPISSMPPATGLTGRCIPTGCALPLTSCRRSTPSGR